jgi:hypothetical protein
MGPLPGIRAKPGGRHRPGRSGGIAPGDDMPGQISVSGNLVKKEPSVDTYLFRWNAHKNR